jgi:excisionase family DNA binding protein
MDLAPLCVSITEAARLVGCGRSKFYSLVKEGRIKTLKIGRRTLVPVTALQLFVTSSTGAA